MSILATFPLSSALQGPFSSLHFYLLALSVWFCAAIILGRGELRETETDLWLKGMWMEEWTKGHLNFYPAHGLPVFTASGQSSLAPLSSLREVGATVSNQELGAQGRCGAHPSSAPCCLYLWKAQVSRSLLFSFLSSFPSSSFLHSLPNLLSFFLNFRNNFSLSSWVTSFWAIAWREKKLLSLLVMENFTGERILSTRQGTHFLTNECVQI